MSMDRFAQLVAELRMMPEQEAFGVVPQHEALLAEYFAAVPSAEAEAAADLLWWSRPKARGTRGRLRELVARRWPAWMVDDCLRQAARPLGAYAALLGESRAAALPLCEALDLDLVDDHDALTAGLGPEALEVYLELYTGVFDPPTTRSTVAQALASVWRCTPHQLHQAAWRSRRVERGPLLQGGGAPAPACAHTWAAPAEPWVGTRRYDGIRAQLVRTAEEVWLWMEEGPLLNDIYPALVQAAHALPPGTHLDGHLVGVDAHRTIDVPAMERAIRQGRPFQAAVCYWADDILVEDGRDVCDLELEVRLDRLRRLCAAGGAHRAREGVGTEVEGAMGEGAIGTIGVAEVRAAASAKGGDVLARRPGPFGAGGCMLSRPPIEVSAVLYSRRASPEGSLTYAFAMEQGGALVPIVSLCPSGTWADILARAAESGTGERHGPVQMLQGERVYRLAVGIAYPSPRRKCGFECRRVEIVEEVEYGTVGAASALSQAARSLLANPA
mgnify:CR=1 FL=1